MLDVCCSLPSGVVPPRQLESFLVDARGQYTGKAERYGQGGLQWHDECRTFVLQSEPDSGESICSTDFSKFLGCLI